MICSCEPYSSPYNKQLQNNYRGWVQVFVLILRQSIRK